MSVDNIHKALLQYWGYPEFREKQEDIIKATLEGKDTLALLPTGGGKSICFQVPALVQEGLCLVISPLIALMQDQVDNLQKKGIKAIAINSAMSRREIDIAIDNAAYGDYKFLYVSPERLETEVFKARLEKLNINLIAVDEAHCISQWGYDFRPSYLNIAKLRESLPETPILALTATATPQVVVDIQEKLEFKQQHVIQKSFERKNLAYVVVEEEDQFRQLLKVIRGVKGSGVVYVNRRKKCKDISQMLQREGISSDYYHAGLNHLQRTEKQAAWIHNKCQVIVATNAFGMGIDKADVRFVVHLDLPESIEAYFQEAGRAGRDGKKAYAVLILSPGMTSNLKSQIEQSFPPIETIKKIYQALGNFFQVPINGGENISFDFKLAEFAERYQFDSLEIYHSLHFLEKEGYISLSENFASPSRIHIKVSQQDLYKFQVSHPNYDHFIKGILRSHGGLFDNYVKIEERTLASNLKISSEKLNKILKQLEQMDLIDYEEKSNLPKLTYTQARLDQRSLIFSKETYSERKKIAFQKMEAMIEYAEENEVCRSQLLLKYFGEENTYRCGICDICLERNKLELNELEFNQIKSQITNTLSSGPKSLDELIKGVNNFQDQKVLEVIDYLLEHNSIYLKNERYSLNH